MSEQAGAHAFYNFAIDELHREQDSKVMPVVWAITGLNLSFLNGWWDSLLRQGRQKWGVVAADWHVLAAHVSTFAHENGPRARNLLHQWALSVRGTLHRLDRQHH